MRILGQIQRLMQVLGLVQVLVLLRSRLLLQHQPRLLSLLPTQSLFQNQPLLPNPPLDCLLALPSRGRHNRAMRLRSAAVWSKVRQRKLLHWADQNRKQGPLAALRNAEVLRAHVVSMRPDWPDTQSRRADWANHKKMRTLFDRMAHALGKKPARKAVRRPA